MHKVTSGERGICILPFSLPHQMRQRKRGENEKKRDISHAPTHHFHSRSRLSDAVKIAGEPYLISSQDSIKESCEDMTVLETFTQQQGQQQQSLSLCFS